MKIEDVVSGAIFIPAKGSITLPGSDSAINVIWEFTRQDITFFRDHCLYTTIIEGATIKFTDEGVLAKGFKIRTYCKNILDKLKYLWML